ncbi:MAG TPA: aldehyde dehydrogenase, partial [Chloroflexi bacterium]|nr:aldehyde dehydrogenase [Chloroflexota bacterium]
MAKQYPYYCAGEWRSSDRPLEIRNPWNDEIVGTTSFATEDDVEDAIRAAEDAFEIMRVMPLYERAAALD